jgi:hypothetical protein
MPEHIATRLVLAIALTTVSVARCSWKRSSLQTTDTFRFDELDAANQSVGGVGVDLFNGNLAITDSNSPDFPMTATSRWA